MGIKLNAANGGGSVELNIPSTVGSDLAVTIPAMAGELACKNSSGNLGIGTSNPSQTLDLESASTTAARITAHGYICRDNWGSATSLGNGMYSPAANALAFATNSTERMRLTSAGEFCIGSTAQFNDGLTNIQFDGSQKNGVCLKTTRTQNGSAFLNFIDSDGNSIGSVQQNTASTVSYVTSSDYRLKENVVEISDGISRVKQLKPSRFNYIKDPNQTVDGFIAHEAQAVVPESVTGEKDGEQMQGIDQSKIVPLLTAALKEAIAKIETLETKVAALEAK